MKYDEEFGPFMPQFVTAVWELLIKTGIETKYDAVSNPFNENRNYDTFFFIDFLVCFKCFTISGNCS